MDGQTRGRDGMVPGNIQYDYGVFRGFGQVHYGTNVDQYRELEDDTWFYRAEFEQVPAEGERIFFVSEGIDYQCELWLNGHLLCTHEGMFSRIEADLTEWLSLKKNILDIKILPHPSSGCPRGTGRAEAKDSCKSPVEYGWDWHPRLLTSGLWQNAWIERRGKDDIRDCRVCYQLNETRSAAQIFF